MPAIGAQWASIHLAAAAAWRDPCAVSGVFVEPCQTWSMFAEVWPCRTMVRIVCALVMGGEHTRPSGTRAVRGPTEEPREGRRERTAADLVARLDVDAAEAGEPADRRNGFEMFACRGSRER